jgi:hypothetical protein
MNLKGQKKSCAITAATLALACLSLLQPMPAQPSPAPKPAAGKPAEQVHSRGRVRVFYQTTGQHTVAPADTNANGVPDIVEDVLTQALAVEKFWLEGLGFPDPFASPRYAGAKHIHIHIHLRHRDTMPTESDRIRQKREVVSVNGRAYSGLMKRLLPGDPPDSRGLRIDLATSVRPSRGSQTLSHEYFHLIQYGACYFRSAWLLEGMARWSEKGLGAGALGSLGAFEVWPLRETELEHLSGVAYHAATIFWNPLVRSVETATGDDGLLPDNAAIRELKTWHYLDGRPVLGDDRFTGWRFMRRLLKELDAADDIAMREEGYETWTSANQRSPRNTPHILRAIERTLAQPED